MPDPTDPTLEERLRAGDGSALAVVVEANRERFLSLIRFRMPGRLSSRLSPEDVLQESYMAALKRIDQCRSDSFRNAFVWLRLIVCQTLTDLCRHHLAIKGRDAHREVALTGRAYPDATSVSIAHHLAATQTSPSGAAIRAESVELVQEAIGTMDETDQEILAMRHFEELTNLEISLALDITPKAASIRYVRALKRLKDILGTVTEGAHGSL